jgi:hypothetical protein
MVAVRVTPDASTRSAIYSQVAVLAGVAFCLGLYLVLRYRGLWGEADTGAMTPVLRATLETGRLEPGGDWPLYPNGYGYQAVIAFLVSLTGIGLVAAQVVGAPLLIVWTVVPAWLLYRRFTGSDRAAALATAILLIQPEFLFATLRGTHEKFTRGLMLLALYLLLRSFESRHQPSRCAGFVVALYLTIYAIFSFNLLLASSFVAGVGGALVVSAVMSRLCGAPVPAARVVHRRLLHGTAISMVIAFLFIFYAYRPAQHDLAIVQTLSERIGVVFFGAEATSVEAQQAQATNPYEVVDAGWVSRQAFLAVSLANWLLLLGASAIWATLALRWLLRRSRPRSPAELLLWALYGAFALQGAMGVASDISGGVTGNTQQRLFPIFAMLGAPLIASCLVRFRAGRPVGRRVALAAWAAVSTLAVLSTFKATNEPIVSNKWPFYSPSEEAALRWADASLSQRPIWVGLDERLGAAVDVQTGGAPRSVTLDQFTVDAGTRDLLVSDLIRQQAARLGRPLPVGPDSLITYDNGRAQIWHSRSKTPYQK